MSSGRLQEPHSCAGTDWKHHPLRCQHSDTLMAFTQVWTVYLAVDQMWHMCENIHVSREMKSNMVEWVHLVL